MKTMGARQNKKGLRNLLKPLYFTLSGYCLYGAPGAIRTRGLRIRSPLLYPAELRAQQEDLLSKKRGLVHKKMMTI
tara:strand:+ start:370 stop:597 length:228 start_codon:yes stop_codon:yes gene_type:complete